ncbi:hypothetical protein ACSXEK_15365 (plasmid) [Clostridium perfringens]
MIVGIAECTISINKNDIVDELYNEVYNPSGGIKNTLITHDTDIELLKEGITLKADKTELDTVKNKKYKARYLRFTLNGANSTTQNRWVEVQAYVGELNILQNLTPSSNKTIYNKTYATDGNIDNSKYTYTDGEGESYLQYDLGQVREDIDFIHLWHYSDGGNVIYNGVKVGLSEDGIEFANVFDSKYTGLYRESERGNFIPVNQGAVVESMMSRIQKAEIKITPDAISNTVRDSMANDFTNSENLLSDGSKISSKKWTNVDNNNFLFDDNNNFAMLNIQNYNNGEITYTFDNPFKLQPDTYHCFHFKVFQEKMLADQRFKITLILSGENINLTEVFDGLVLSEIPNIPAKLFKYTFKTSNKLLQSIHSINIKVERKTTLNTPATLVIKEPQFEMGAFPTQWTYPYNLGLKEFESYREQTSKQISERVTSKDFESYKTQTAKEIAQIVKDTDGNFSSVNQKVDSITTNLKDVKNAQEPNLIKNSTGINNLEWWKQISGDIFNVKTSNNDRLYYKKPYFTNDGIVMTARFKVKPDTKYYLSVFLNSIQSTQVSIKIWYSSKISTDVFDTSYTTSQGYIFPSNSNWTKNNKSIITPSDITIKEAYITVSPNSGVYTINFGELLFIEGEETGWRPAYDDSNANSSYFGNIIKDVEQKITPDGIYTEIKKSSSYNSEVVNEISTLKQTSGELSNRIENVKNTAEGTQSEFTEFKQTSEEFQLTIKEGINSTNIVDNGNFKGGIRHWWGEATEEYFYWDVYHGYESYGFGGRSVLSMKNTHWFGTERRTYSSKCYEVQPNTDYTLNLHYCVEQNIQECRVYIIMSNTLEGTYEKVYTALTAYGGQKSNLSDDIPHSFKFNTGQYKYVWLSFNNLGIKNGANWQEHHWFMVSDVAIYKGDTGSIKFIPNTNELYGNTIKADKDEIRCDFENGAYNLISRKGNRWYAPGMEYPYHFLSHHEAISITTDGTSNYITRDIKLPARFNYVSTDEIFITSSLKGWYKYKGEMFALESISVSTAKVYRDSSGTYAQVAAYGHIRRSSDFGSEGLQVNVTLHVTA